MNSGSRGIFATTHLDRHGERLTKDDLEKIVASYKTMPAAFLFWDHFTLLPPIGVITDAWVEQREDGEYQAVAEFSLFDEGDTQHFDTELPSFGNESEELKNILNNEPLDPTCFLQIRTDPRNYDPGDVALIVERLNEFVDTGQQTHIRKSTDPLPVIWVLVLAAIGAIGTGFLARIGERAADKVIDQMGKYYQKTAGLLGDLFGKAKQADGKALIFQVPIYNSEIGVEGVIENPTEDMIILALQRLPVLYAQAKYILQNNRPGFFSCMQFVFNPTADAWEVNYLVTRNHRVILGPKYYNPEHPSHSSYGELISKLDKQGNLGMSFGSLKM